MLVLVIGFSVVVFTDSARAQDYQRTTLSVEKLVCTSCLSFIETTLQQDPGVVGMTADLSAGTVVVDHVKQISGKQLAERISGLGYPARLVKQEAVADRQLNRFSNAFARCGVGGCGTGGGCNATVSAWKELYHRYIAIIKGDGHEQ